MTQYHYLKADGQRHYDLVSEALYDAVRGAAMAAGHFQASAGRFSGSGIKGKIVKDDWEPPSPFAGEKTEGAIASPEAQAEDLKRIAKQMESHP